MVYDAVIKTVKGLTMFVTRYNPHRGMGEARRGFELLNSLMNNLEVSKEDTVLTSFVPAVNTREGEFAYHIEVDLPGISRDEIEITTEDNVLTISGERRLKEESKEEDYYKVESSYGKFTRSFTLPEKVDVASIQAEFVNGVLEVTIPKLKEEETKPTKIEIK